ncbi:uncharacterized [Tachysurus ichikawai]
MERDSVGRWSGTVWDDGAGQCGAMERDSVGRWSGTVWGDGAGQCGAMERDSVGRWSGLIRGQITRRLRKVCAGVTLIDTVTGVLQHQPFDQNAICVEIIAHGERRRP